MTSTKTLIVALALSIPLAVSCTRRAETPEVDSTEATNPANETTETTEISTMDTTTDTTTGATTGAVDNTDRNLEGDPDMSVTDQGSDPTWTGATGDRVRSGSQTESTMSTSESATGDTFQRAQAALERRGYEVSDTPAGGPETTRAIQQFQSENRLQVTGAFDEETLRALGVSGSDRTPASVPSETDMERDANDPINE